MSRFPEKKRYAVTFSIDDGFWHSCKAMAAVFAPHRIRATFNLVTHWVAPMQVETIDDVYNQNRYHGSWPEWKTLLEAGHEIGCHTATHPALPTRTPDEIRWELDASRETLLEHLPLQEPLTFAYPYNQTSPEVDAEVRKRFLSARVGGEPLNHPEDLNLYAVQSWWPYRDTALEEILARIDEAREKEAWLVLGLHGVGDEGWHPIPIDKLEAVASFLAHDSDVYTDTFKAMSEWFSS